MTGFPALGFDPAPGSPGVLAGLSRDTARAAQEMAALDRELRRLGDLGTAWRGEAADCFAAAVDELPGHLRTAHDSFAGAARALSIWSSELAELQTRAAAAERDAEEALASLRAARAAGLPPRPDGTDSVALTDWFSASAAHARRVQAAEDALEAARARARRVQDAAEDGARRAERAVRAAAEAAPPKPGLLQRIGGSIVDGVKELNKHVGDWVRENAGVIAAVTDAVSTVAFLAGFVPGVGTTLMLVVGGAVLLSTAALAAYTDEKDLTDVGLAGAGLVLGGAAAAAGRAARLARAAELGHDVTSLPSMFTPGLTMGFKELVWRSVQLQPTLAGMAVGTVDTLSTARDRGLLPSSGSTRSARVRSTEPGRAVLERQPA